MSGHSKWANIRVRKTAQDSRRGKIYTRHARLIEIAAQMGGGDPATNHALRTAIDNAKADSVPNANIERAIKKGTGELKGEQMAEVLYAAMAPGGVACLIECLTDNRNRTLANLKSIIQKNGGTFAESSSVLWMFHRKGVALAEIPESPSSEFIPSAVEGLRTGSTQIPEDIELQLIEMGAEDIDVDDGIVTVTSDGAKWTKVRDVLKSAGLTIESAGLKYVPSQTVNVDAAAAEKLSRFVEVIEEDDDVSEVHTNAHVTM